MDNKKIMKLREYFFSVPSLFGRKTEKDFKILFRKYEFAELKRIANTSYKIPPKNYAENVQKYNELKQLLGGA